MMNNVMLVGRLTRDAELRETESGKKVTNITIATQRPYKNNEGIYETDFIDCTLWGKMAETICEHFHKGDLVGVKGRLETTTDKDNNKRLNLNVEKMTLVQSIQKNKKEVEHDDR